MSRHQAERSRLNQTADDGLGAEASIVRISAGKNLVEQKQQWQRAARQIDDLADAEDLRIETGPALLERVLNSQGGPDRQGREAQAPRSHRRSGQSQDRIDPGRSQKRAFSGHIRSTNDQYTQSVHQVQIVSDTARSRQ